MLFLYNTGNYQIYSGSNEKSWKEADTFCVQQYGTHLSTIQSTTDEQSVIDNAKQMVCIISNLSFLSIVANHISHINQGQHFTANINYI